MESLLAARTLLAGKQTAAAHVDSDKERDEKVLALLKHYSSSIEWTDPSKIETSVLQKVPIERSSSFPSNVLVLWTEILFYRRQDRSRRHVGAPPLLGTDTRASKDNSTSSNQTEIDLVAAETLNCLKNALRPTACRKWLLEQDAVSFPARGDSEAAMGNPSAFQQLLDELFAYLSEEIKGQGDGALCLGLANSCIRSLVMSMLESKGCGEEHEQVAIAIAKSMLRKQTTQSSAVSSSTEPISGQQIFAVDPERVRSLVFVSAVRRVLKMGSTTLWVQVEAQRTVARLIALFATDSFASVATEQKAQSLAMTRGSTSSSLVTSSTPAATDEWVSHQDWASVFIRCGAVKVLCDMSEAKSPILRVESLSALNALLSEYLRIYGTCSDIFRKTLWSQTQNGESVPRIVEHCISHRQATEGARSDEEKACIGFTLQWWRVFDGLELNKESPGYEKDAQSQRPLLVKLLKEKLNQDSEFDQEKQLLANVQAFTFTGPEDSTGVSAHATSKGAKSKHTTSQGPETEQGTNSSCTVQ